MPFVFDPYVAPAALRNGHCMTVFAWARPRRFTELPPPVERLFDVAPKTRLLAKCHWQEHARERSTLLLLHGLEGSADAHYIRGIADKGWSAGFNVIRLNQRNCGGTDHLSEGVYHSGLTDDPMAVIRELVERDGLRSIVVAGYSLGGNVAMRMAGEYGDKGPREVRGFAAVSPTIDLELCMSAMERRWNRLYELNFLRELKVRIRRKSRLYPGVYSLEPLRRIRTLRQFDDEYTAPMSGFRDAADYYYRAGAMRVVSSVQVPALVVAAEDDPLVPVEQFGGPGVSANPRITVIITRHGGHCGFIEARRKGLRGGDAYWAERIVVSFAAQLVRPLS